MLPSKNQMIEDIQSEFILDVTFGVKTVAGMWRIAKTSHARNDDELAGQLLIAQADDLLQPIDDYESTARAAGWVPSKQPGMVTKGDAIAVPCWADACEMDSLEVIVKKPIAVYVVDPQLFAQLSLMQEQRLDQSFMGLPVFATWRNEDELKEFCATLMERRQQEIWQHAIGKARQRFHFTDHSVRVPFFGRVAPWRDENYGTMQRETSE